MRRKWSIDDFREIASERKGKCLSDEYVNMHTHLDFSCDICGFEWSATPSSIVSGRWCRRCAARKRADKQKLTIEMMQELARRKGGRCLSDSYENANTHLIWKCRNPDHQPFRMIPSAVKQGQWCNECANEVRGNYQLLDIPTLQEIARERGGECLSTAYEGVHSKLLWRCAHGHEFEMVPADVKNQGSWCPTCATGWGERLCRQLFEGIFGSSFPRCKPEWLKNPQGNRLELDGFSEELRIAFEHQGEHHYKDGVFSKSNSAFKRILLHDRIKRERCADVGIILIEIPEVGTRTKVEDLRSFILLEATRSGVEGKVVNASFTPDWREVYAGGYDYIERLRAIAQEHGGRLLTDEWKGQDVAVILECKMGHRFKMKPSGVYQGAWCQECAGNRPGTIEEMRRIAKERGGECLSHEYVNGKTKLKWRCLIHDHTWWNTPNNIKRGQWCILCAGRRKWTIEAVRALAQARGGSCLSDEYRNTKAKLRFRCGTCGHIWDTTLSSLLNGSFCPRCGLERVLKKTRKSIDEMHEIAAQHGGSCLSTRYVNSHTPLVFKCRNQSHPPWKAAPTNIRRGKWCRLCAIERIKE